VALGLQHVCRRHFDGLVCRLNQTLVQKELLLSFRKALQDQALSVLQDVLISNQCVPLSGCAWRDGWLEHAGLDHIPGIVWKLPGSAARNT